MRHLKPILFAVFVLVALTLSCVEPLDIVSPDGRNRFPADALIISPRVLGVPATKANIDGDESLNENKLASLDIFVYRKSGGTNYFFHRYSLNESQTQQLVSGHEYLLESNWRTARYQNVGYEGNSFKIYVLANLAVNDRATAIPASPTEAQLQAFISTSKQSISGSYDVVRLVDGEGPGTDDWYNPHIKDNLFLMDGMIDNWTPASNAAQQYFTLNEDKSFELRRAAAKFKVTLDFDPDFLDNVLGTADADTLNFTKVTETWANGNTKTEVVTNIGNAQYKFANFMPATYDFNPAGTVSPEDLKAFRDANLWESEYRYDFSDRTPASTTGSYKYPYETTTYSYAFSWGAAEAAEKAPALAVSIIYTRTTKHYNEAGELTATDDPVAETNYYRIPLVDVVNATTPVTEVHRNYFYQVDALISSMGAAIIDIEPTPVKLKYQVIPWSFNPATDITEVEGTELLYFTADTTYTLRGENMQSIRLDYFTPKSELLNTGLYKYEPTLSNVHVYYKPDANTTTNINVAGNRPGSYSNGNTQWSGSKASSNETVTIRVEPAADGGGKVYITSQVLANRAVKHIEFDASVTFEVPILDANGQPTGRYDEITVTHHYIIQHFPLDNIQSVLGWWSSRWDGQTASGSTTTYYRKRFYKENGSSLTEITQAQWAAGIGNSNDDRRNANSPENAINGYYATGGSPTSNQYNSEVKTVTGYTWNGTTVTMSGTYGPQNNQSRTWSYSGYDYVVSTSVSGNNQNARATTVLWKYSNYYHYTNNREYSYSPTGDDGSWTSYDGFEWEVCTQAEYNATATENRKVETVKNHPGTGTWVAYGTQAGYNQGTTYANSSTYTGSNSSAGYYAKVWDESTSTTRIYRVTGNGATGQQSNVGTDDDGKNNPHMYVIQISKAETGVILGRPQINSTTYQSNDNVVSPAFMIASQLGAVSSSSYDESSAAQHCHTYMEVADNGRRFVNWRLPTKAEITYIVNYQKKEDIINDGVFAEVLGGNFYYTLDGGNQATGMNSYNGGTYDNGVYVRCIRDLTPAEVAELNSTGTITEATY